MQKALLSFCRALFCFVLIQASGARASVISPLNPDLLLSELQISEVSQMHESFLKRLTPEKDLVLLPVFTKCKMSCPVMAQALKRASAHLSRFKPELASHVQYVVLSFDVTDQAGDLDAFRKHGELPKDWLVARADDQQGVREFFDRFKYPIMSEDGGFNHPNQFFVLNRKHQWTQTVFGTDFSDEDLAQAIESAIRSDHPSLLGSTVALFRNPEELSILGGLGLVFAAIVSMWVVARSRSNPTLDDRFKDRFQA